MRRATAPSSTRPWRPRSTRPARTIRGGARRRSLSGCSRVRHLGYPGRVSQIAPLSPVVPATDAVRMVRRSPGVDAVGLEARAADLATRSIKKDAKLWALDLVIRSMDLTSLEGSDTVGKIVAMCAK